MRKLIFFTKIVVLSLGLMTQSSALAAHQTASELRLSLLFQASPAKLGRELSSLKNTSKHIPGLRFLNSVQLNSKGEARLGKHCSLRARNNLHETQSNLFNEPLSRVPGVKLQALAYFDMRLVSFQTEVLQVELKNKNQNGSILLECTHPQVQSWTVSDLESNADQKIKVKIPFLLASLKMKKKSQKDQTLNLGELKGSVVNGLFGSGLPGTMGIQLLLGANLKAYANENDAPLMVGRKCRLMSQTNPSLGDTYLKGSKFAFREYRVNAQEGKVELIFDNWNHSPHQVRVECRGSENDLKAMSVASVEHDLNGTIQFYHK